MSYRFLRSLMLLLALLVLRPCEALEQPLLTNLANRQTISLNGAWQAIVDPYEAGYYNYRREPYDRQTQRSNSAFYSNHHATDKAELVEYDFDKSPTLNVPGDWNSQSEKLFYYEELLCISIAMSLHGILVRFGRKYHLLSGRDGSNLVSLWTELWTRLP